MDDFLYNRPTKEELIINPLKLDMFQFEPYFVNISLKEKAKRKIILTP